MNGLLISLRLMLVTLIYLRFSVTAVAESDVAQCKEWGFSDPACADCDSLASFVKDDDELVNECKACCIKEAVIKYTSAHFHVCPHRLA